MDRRSAWELVTEFVSDAGLRRHMLAVEVAMRHYAKRLNGDLDKWAVVGMIHDFDWQIHPQLPDHPVKGAEILRKRSVDESIIRAVLSHAEDDSGVTRRDPIDFALLACDEVTGLIIATALVRPSKDIRDVKVQSIKKKWKNRAFAAGVDREHVEAATADFARACFEGRLELWEHVGHVLEAMQSSAEQLDLDGRLAAS